MTFNILKRGSMRLTNFVYHLADKLLPIKPPYEKHALTEATSRTIAGVVLIGIFVMVVRRFFHLPDEATYLLQGLRDSNFDHRLVYGCELLLAVTPICYTLGRLTFGLVAWFRRHVGYRWPTRKIKEFLRERSARLKTAAT